MKNFEKDFLKDKYWSNEKFRGATDAAAKRTKARTGEPVQSRPSERIENYLNRFTEITDREDSGKRERGVEAIRRLVEQKYVAKPENISDDYIKKVLLGNQAEAMGYDREDLKDENIRRTVLAVLEQQIRSPLSSYRIPAETRREVETMVITDQRERMNDWLSYLTGEESRHAPAALRYWAFAEMLKQGDYDPVRGEYNKREKDTVAIFPELDQQALAFVFDEVERKRAQKPSALALLDESKKKDLETLLQSENFGKLYAFMQEYVRGLRLPEERLVVTKGEWRTFRRGTAPQELTAPLQTFQTKWCIAGEGHAASYLNHSDVHVYFSEDADGSNSIPRACVVEDEDRGITEVRGIVFTEDVKQHLDDYITPVVDEKLKTMKGGGKWQETMADMTRLRELHFKHLAKESLTKDDLTFLYELNRPIRDTGYGRDPRIAELRDARDTDADLPILFDCAPEDIAHSISEIRNTTKAYVGKLETGIFDVLPQSVVHVYTNFPKERIKFRNTELGTGIKDGPAFQKAIDEQDMKAAENLLRSPDFKVVGEYQNVELVEISVVELGFGRFAKYENICTRASEFGLKLCPAEVGPQLRLQYKDQPLDEYFIVAMKAIRGSDGNPGVFVLYRYDDKLYLDAVDGTPAGGWPPESRFVFLRPRKPR